MLGFSVLKGGSFLNDDIENLIGENLSSDWEVILDYHFGGYAKKDQNLIAFCSEFERDYKISIEPIYTGKMLFGLFDLIQRDFFPCGTTIVALHTGGLQGRN